jgi:Legionella pneumophila major outer membrane protein precursor
MFRSIRPWISVAFLGSFLAPATLAQGPSVPPQPVPVTPLQPQPQGQVTPIPVPRADPGPPPGPAPFAPVTPIPQFGDSGPPNAVDPKCILPTYCGFYGLIDLTVLFPQIGGTLRGPVTVTGLPPTTVSLGSASLETTGSLRLEVGYRLAEGIGAVAVSYRSLVSKGGQNEAPFGPFGNPFLSSLINVNVVDIDYVSPAFNLAPMWNISGRAGIRTAGVYYQNVLVGTLAQQEATSNFVGAGPHAELEVGRAIPEVPGLAVLAKLDGAILVGNVSQSFEETLQTKPPIGGATVTSSTQAVPTVTFDLGLSYTPPGNFNWARFGFGYQFEYWWDIGKNGSSSGNLMTNGIYFRGGFNF